MGICGRQTPRNTHLKTLPRVWAAAGLAGHEVRGEWKHVRTLKSNSADIRVFQCRQGGAAALRVHGMPAGGKPFAFSRFQPPFQRRKNFNR